MSTPIYHITHIDNLTSIITSRGLIAVLEYISRTYKCY
ncbi:DarT ssDNA thymidine ADP-ribosyltransferase family protein [Okeanomitos corallinicola]